MHFEEKQRQVTDEVERLNKTVLGGTPEVNEKLKSLETTPQKHGVSCGSAGSGAKV